MKTFFFFFGEHLNLDRETVQILVKTFFFLFLGEHLSLGRKTVQISVKTFFLENTLIWAEKTVSISTEKRNASSHFSGKTLVPYQIILSSYGHGLRRNFSLDFGSVELKTKKRSLSHILSRFSNFNFHLNSASKCPLGTEMYCT